ncbi:hypothetical protein NLJ89_g8627 [Agrocybe chaxingu]|uniref:FAD dependent oxidoreductase domain-containing protein n=1 Tax=Agrocybe chaxingu TaxID=84603 RepID=A0A9W8JX66_9AGAR|nr:hypothetical protein NLJ89_g8627 [Agrocybe chaxingu]
MYGGGAVLGGKSEDALLDNIGISDDSGTDFVVEAYLAGSLERYFADQWGAEGNEADTEAGSPPPPARGWGKGRLKAVWTGIIGMSADFQPWVGRVPKVVSGRKEPDLSLAVVKGLAGGGKKGVDSFAKHRLAPPGEWISAGFTGEGMVHAWLSGKALARMVLGQPSADPEAGDIALPAPFLITEKRVKRANIEETLASFA